MAIWRCTATLGPPQDLDAGAQGAEVVDELEGDPVLGVAGEHEHRVGQVAEQLHGLVEVGVVDPVERRLHVALGRGAVPLGRPRALQLADPLDGRAELV